MNSRLALDGLCFLGLGPFDLTLDQEECVTLTGVSGSGKTLLLRSIADLDPHQGLVYCDRLECGSMEAPEWRRRVGLLTAESFWWGNTVGQHFCEPTRADPDALGFTSAVFAWSIARLSTGERQRLSLLRLLENKPRVLLLDEPTANLDEENTLRVETLVAGYRQDTGAAVLWVTHDEAQARRVGSRRYRLEEGRLAKELVR